MIDSTACLRSEPGRVGPVRGDTPRLFFRDAQVRAEVEQGVLHTAYPTGNFFRKIDRHRGADDGIQLIHTAVGNNAEMRFGNTAAIAE